MPQSERKTNKQRSLAMTSSEELAASIPRIGAPLALKVKRFPDSVFDRSVKAVVNEYLSCAEDAEAFVFDRFVGQTLHEVGAAEINELPSAAGIRVTKQPTTGLARLPLPPDASFEASQLILAVEAAINRAIDVARLLVLAAEHYTEEPDAQVIPISFGRAFSVSYLSEKRKQDRQHLGNVALSTAGNREPFTETTLPLGLLNLLDWLAFDNAAIDTVSVFQCATCPNELISILGTSAPRGSDWDTRSRFASILEHIALPLRLRYQFDCGIDAQAGAVAFEIPSLAGFPTRIYQPESDTWEETASRAEELRCVYLLRVTALLAAACFGAGLPIEHATVTAYSQGFDSAPVLSCQFDRTAFTAQCMEAVRTGALNQPEFRFDYRKIIELIAPQKIALDFDPTVGFRPICALPTGLEGRRNPLWQDTRRLPRPLARFFHTSRLADLDTRYYLGGKQSAQCIDDAVTDSRDSVIAAIFQLESLVDELEAKLPKLTENQRFLHCDHPAARACVDLLKDRLSVSAQAQAYLRTGEFDPSQTSISTSVQYVRLPDALFNAYTGLADLYQRAGDYKGANAMADRCIALAPTSIGGYLRKADILAGKHKFNQAINVLTECLQYLVLEQDYAAVYQSLALIHWHAGRQKTAIALYVLTSYLHGEPAEVAKRFILRGKHNQAIAETPLTSEQATHAVARAGIPLAPTEAARACIAKAAIELSNCGYPLAAAPYALYLSDFAEGDGGSIALKSVSSSLQYGVDTMEL